MRVLMVSRARDWLGPPRLASSLAAAGAATSFLADEGSMLSRLRHADHRFVWSAHAARHLQDLEQAIDIAIPDRLLPADEPAALWLREVHDQADTPTPLRTLIERSLGNPEHFASCGDKLAVTRLAAANHLATPITQALDKDADAGPFVHRHGWPVVVKSRRGFAGIGVYPCASLRDLRHALRNCPRDGGRLIQQFCEGMTWMTAFVAERGRVLGQLCFAKERQHPEPIGPSTIVRCEVDPEMQGATQSLVQALGYSGFGSIDYLCSRDGRRLLLEFNPRPVPVCHLGKRLGVDLAAAYVDGVPRDNAAACTGTRIALFPQELRRDSSGAGLAGCIHDVPHDEPELLAALSAMLDTDAARRINHTD